MKPSFCYLFIMKKKNIGRYLLSVLLVGVVGVSVVFSLSAPVDSLKYHIYRLFGDTSLPELPLQFPEKRLSPVEMIAEDDRGVYDWILIGAREEVYRGTRYDDAYYAIDYPGGDIDPQRGACSDVIVRALRRAGYDLQKLIHQDMKQNFHLYPQMWGLSAPDPNIDHRRVANQMVFFERHGDKLSLAVDEENLSNWQHGHIVCWRYPDGRLHTGIISDRTNVRGVPLVIHNAWQTVEDDCLTRWEIIGHFRYPREG